MDTCSVGTIRHLRWITAALVAVGCCGSPALAANYYVRTGGNDSSIGTSPSAAFRSIHRAAKAASSGDFVYVGAGTYAGEIVVDGVQQSAAPLTFTADTDGTFTGDAGPVIIGSQQLGVVNSNSIEFHKFEFRNAAARFLVWKSSYDGVFKQCRFDGGEPMLIKDGSVRFEDCVLTNFTTDAIYVDGEALVELVNSSISNCQGEGIEVAKTARVLLDATTIENNVGDGIKVAQTASFVDDGGLGAFPGVTERLVAAKYRIVASAGHFDGYDSSLGLYGAGNSGQAVDLYGNALVSIGASVPVQGNAFYGPSGSASVPNISGSITQMSGDITMNAIDVGDAATNNNNANIPLTDMGNDPHVGSNLVLSNGDGLDLPPGTYHFTQLSVSGGAELRITGPTIIYVTNRITLSGGSIANPTQAPSDLKLLVTGSQVTLSGSAAVHAAIYAPSARVSMSGSTSIYGMVVANEILTNSTGGIHLDKSLIDYAAEVQGLPLSGSSPMPPSSWSPVAEGEVHISDSTLQRNRRAVDIETPSSFVGRNSSFLDNTEWGLCLRGSADLGTSTIEHNGVGGIWLTEVHDGDLHCSQLTIGDNPSYGIYLQDCDVTLDGVMLDPPTFTSGCEYLLASQGGALTLDGVTLTGGSVAGIYTSTGTLVVRNSTISGSGYGIGVDHSTVDVENCTLTGNETGLYARQNAALSVVNSILSSNTAWGAAVTLTATANATATFTGTTISGNAGGIAFLDATQCTISLSNTLIENHTNEGLRFENSDIALDATALAGLQLVNNRDGIYALNSTLNLDGLALSGNLQTAVSVCGGNVTIANSSLSGGSYGVSANNNSTITIHSCALSGTTAGFNADQNNHVAVVGSTFTGGQYGLWASGNTLLEVDSSSFSGSTVYGVYLAGNGSLQNSSITGNASGLYLNAGNATDVNLAGTNVSGNSSYGVYVYQGSLTLVSQPIDGWSIDGNGYNLAAYEADITLTNATLTNAASYGLYAQYGSVAVQQSTIHSNSGGMWCFHADSFTIDQTHVLGASAGSWAVFNYESGLTMRNSLISGSPHGVYSYGTFKDAAVHNSTIADAVQYGLYVHAGNLTVMNTIISGSNGSSGLSSQAGANVTHSHNLVDGFAMPFENLTPDPTELLESPRFVDAANGDYRLAKGSPAINAGTDLSASFVVDILGSARPSHKVFEIGAYEYTSDAGSLRVLRWKETR